jgi:hypothetical protein
LELCPNACARTAPGSRASKPVPPPHSVKYFAASELMEQVQDRAWLAKEKCRREKSSG